MLDENAFGYIVASGRLILYVCVEIRLNSAILFTSKCTDHVISAKWPYGEILGIFKRGNTFSRESGETEILIIC